MKRRRSDSKESRSKKQRLTYEEKLAHVSKFFAVDPTNRRSVTERYNKLKRVPTYLQRVVSDVETLSELKRRGFFTTQVWVIVDSPRDVHREQISGSRFRINKDATIVWSVKDRRDYIVGFTRAEKKEFAKDPKGFTARKLAELQKKYPSLKHNPQVRLQWGAYQAQKDFHPQAFERLSTWQQFRAMYGIGRRKRSTDVDRLTGLHVVIHLPRKRKKRVKKKD